MLTQNILESIPNWIDPVFLPVNGVNYFTSHSDNFGSANFILIHVCPLLPNCTWMIANAVYFKLVMNSHLRPSEGFLNFLGFNIGALIKADFLTCANVGISVFK